MLPVRTLRHTAQTDLASTRTARPCVAMRIAARRVEPRR
jgi:hypothetical protein